MRKQTRPQLLKVRVSPETYDTIKQLSLLSGEPMSATINELIESLLPGIKETIQCLREVEKMNSQAKASLASALTNRANVLETAVKETIEKARDDIRQHKLPL